MKETYYFSHDYNPSSDPKIQAMLGEYGAVGYGVFWRIIEMLHSENENRLCKKKYVFLALAKQMLTSVEQIEAFVNDCINVFELFESDEQFFWSNRVDRNVSTRKSISELRSAAGKISAERRKKQQNPTSVEQVLTSVEQNSTKLNKEKEIKEEEILLDTNKSVVENFEKKFSHAPDELIIDNSLNEVVETPPPQVAPAPPPKIGDGVLQQKCREFAKENKGKYPMDMYVHFLNHWTAIIQKGSGKGNELWYSEKTFQLASRLATWYNIEQKNGRNTTIHNPKTTGRQIIERHTEPSSILREGADGIVFRVEKNGVKTFAG